MSATQYFNHASHRQSEELAYAAERAARLGNVDESLSKYSLAAEPELHLAKSIGQDGQEPLLRGIFAVSAASLYLKARKWDEARTAACYFLAEPNLLSSESQGSLTSLLDTIRREALTADAIAKIPGSAMIDLLMIGGRVGVGQVPADEAANRRSTVTATITRVGEWMSGRQFRRSGQSTIGQSITVYEQPSYPGSFGIRFFIAKRDQRRLPLGGQDLTPTSVVNQVMTLAIQASQNPESLVTTLGDTDYFRSILQSFRDLAGDGSSVESVVLSGDKFAFEAVKMDSGFRDRLTQSLNDVNRREATRVEIVGTLKFVNLRGTPQIGVDTEDGFKRLRIEPGVHDDTIGAKVNRRVRVVGSNQEDEHGVSHNWAYDIQIIEQSI